MNIEDRIIEVLSDGKPLKGKEIANILATKHGLNIDKSEINSLLYRALRGRAVQNKYYQWTLRSGGEDKKGTSQDATRSGTPLSKLAYYYLECLSKDMEGGISVYARSKYNADYTQLNSFPSGSESQRIDKHLLDKVRNDKNNFVFKLGYPNLVLKLQARNSNNYYKVEPLFIFSIDTEHAIQSGTVRLTDEDPVLNPKALGSITKISSASELLLEMVELYEELGVNNDPEDKPDMGDLLMRLQQTRNDWPWAEDIGVTKLSKHAIASIEERGIYNSAAVFIGEKSKYTVGLERDLKDLSKLQEGAYSNSALGALINNSVGSSTISDKVLIEPIPLNEEQREAILKGLTSPLTVVTGPPGTGKSQVVASLIVNAVYQGQTILFSSKNNKAVDVVTERVNALSNRQVMLRLGSQFQTTLAEYLSSLLSARPSADDEARYNEAKSIHEQRLQQIEAIKKRQDHVITSRNKVDQLESSLEKVREELGSEFFALCESFSMEALSNIDRLLKSAREKLNASNRTSQPILVRLLWSYFKVNRFAEARQYFDSILVHATSLGVAKPLVPLEDSTIHEYEKYMDSLLYKAKRSAEIKEYFSSLHVLNQLEDLFQLSIKEKQCTDQVVANSLELWNDWLQLLPTRMSQTDRIVIGDYVAVLNLIVASETSKQPIDRKVWTKYYSFLPQISHIFSCWAVTSLSARGRVPLEAGFFDLVVIDEASQCDIASALPLLYRAKRAVIIGDDKQLTHISTISEIQDRHLMEKYALDDNYMGWSYSATSLFRLASAHCKPENVVVLRDHHRSHADIINYSNKFFYENTLRVATKYENLKLIPNEPAVRWIDVKGKCFRPETGSSINDKEAEQVVKELTRLVSTGYKGSIGVVTPFHAQSMRIMDKINLNKDLADRLMVRHFLCDTVHKFQGDERDVMIFSPVVSEGITEGAVSFLKRTGKLFNVAITRARAALIVVGDKQASYSAGIEHYKGFVEYLNNLDQRAVDPTKVTITDFGPKYPKVSSKTMVSDWEKYLYEALYRAGIHTTPQYQVGQYSLDLALFDGERKLNIEIDGEKYHRNWDGELLKRDQLRNKRLIELGWDVQRFWVYQVRDNMKQCVEKVKEWKSQ